MEGNALRRAMPGPKHRRAPCEWMSNRARARLFFFQVILDVGLVPLLAHPLLPLLLGLALADRLARRQFLPVLRHVLLAPLQHLHDMPPERGFERVAHLSGL